MTKKCMVFLMVFFLKGLVPASVGAEEQDAGVSPEGETPEGSEHTTLVMISPLFGWVRNEMSMHGERGQVTKKSETAPMYGLFFMAMHKKLVLTDYLFYSNVNDTDVWGNLAYINWYGSRKARLSWNVGAGHLYHKIKPSNEDITVTVPMLKTGPIINIPEYHLSINPYIGYAWERIETRRANVDNDSVLYGINAGWRWRMLGATVQYYYQDSREADDNYHTLRVRAHSMFNRKWGATIRLDYMEHYTSDDTSIQFGPIYVF